MNHTLNIDKAVNHHKREETNEVDEDLSQKNPTQGLEIESGEFGVQDIHEEIIDDTQKTSDENIKEVCLSIIFVYFTLKLFICFFC